MKTENNPNSPDGGTSTEENPNSPGAHANRDHHVVGTKTWPAAVLARAIGQSVRNVRDALSGIPPDGESRTNGSPTREWRVDRLPQRLQERLLARAERYECASVDELLANPKLAGRPAPSIAHASNSQLRAANMLMEVLVKILPEWKDKGNQALLERACADYEKRRSVRITTRHMRNLVCRTIARDGGLKRWYRLWLYLPESAIHTHSKPKPEPVKIKWDFAADLLAAFGDPKKPTEAEKCVFWDSVFERLTRMTSAGYPERMLLRSLREFTEVHVVYLGCRGRSLDRQIRRLLSRWKKKGQLACALTDGRKTNCGAPTAVALPKRFLGKLVARVFTNGGQVALAWREAFREGWVPATVAAAYPHDPAHKSYVPRTVRHVVSRQIRLINASKIGSYINRTHTDIGAGEVMQSDDLTPPIIVWFDDGGAPLRDDEGKPVLLRGQLLPWICTRTDYVITAQFIPAASYDAIDILNGIIRVHDDYGLPDVLYLENGTWRARLIAGGKLTGAVPWEDRALGLSAQGVKVRYAEPGNPRSKVIENYHGRLQNRMNRLRGYVGRRPDDCPEETARAMRLVRSGQAHPGEYFYSHIEMMTLLTRIMDELNEEPQNGKRLEGLSPREAFERFRVNPPVKLGPAYRYLFACSRIEVTVRSNGVRLLGKYQYKGEAASPFIGQRMLAWFNPKDLATICLTDLDHQNPITLERELVLDSMTATSAQIAEARRQNKAMHKYGRTLYTSLRKNFPEEFLRARRTIDNPAAAALGQAIEAGGSRVRQERADNQKALQAAAATAAQIGVNLKGANLAPEQLHALAAMAKSGVNVEALFGRPTA